ncbi:GNAT family N-acetyltransferase [Actinoalloteichus hoggarensis]|uniref:Acetyltransferase (GNAT) family protein n=1 Tax=Actinoalloteichus hoggarensis TaxID=1470176 RepID=A0A221W3Q3_9PSEU|nr:GNAT family N-acetyltransferase [Actinoalloteichus hoggarensis]ASO20279.1 Acetyltransferase (GNAT) family protein [Actinoalloteichus hoggarensis]
MYRWRGEFDSAAVEALHAEGFGHEPGSRDWRGQVGRHSLGWVCAWSRSELVGFVNVAWDGAGHAFLVDTVVARSARRRGVGTGLVSVATREASAAGCEWLHVDFADDLSDFYLTACGLRPTAGGLVAL